MPYIIRIVLPIPLQSLTRTGREVAVLVEGTASLEAVLETLETSYPMLRGTIRDQVTKQRRPFIRFFACGEDFSQDLQTTILPEAVITGMEPLRVVAAMSGG